MPSSLITDTPQTITMFTERVRCGVLIWQSDFGTKVLAPTTCIYSTYSFANDYIAFPHKYLRP